MNATELFLVVRCGELLLALPAAAIERVALPEDAESLLGELPLPVEAALPPVRIGEGTHAGWDLGELLGVGPQSAAWVVLRLPHPGGPRPAALRTGPCLNMIRLSLGTTLPRGIFARRPAVVRALHFVTTSRGTAKAAERGTVGAPVFELVPDALLDAGERAFAEETLSSLLVQQ